MRLIILFFAFVFFVPSLGYKWQSLAEQGHAHAQLVLGVMYAEGKGVRQDYKEAYAWCDIAASQGSTPASELRDLVAKKLDSATLLEAQSLSRIYYEKYVEPF